MSGISEPSALDIFPPPAWFVSLGCAVPRGVHSSPRVQPLDPRCTFLSFLHVIPHAASTPRLSSPFAARTGTAPPCVQPRPSRPQPLTSTRHTSRSPTLLPLRYPPFLPHAPHLFPHPVRSLHRSPQRKGPSLPLSHTHSLSLCGSGFDWGAGWNGASVWLERNTGGKPNVRTTSTKMLAQAASGTHYGRSMAVRAGGGSERRRVGRREDHGLTERRGRAARRIGVLGRSQLRGVWKGTRPRCTTQSEGQIHRQKRQRRVPLLRVLGMHPQRRRLRTIAARNQRLRGCQVGGSETDGGTHPSNAAKHE